jgi:RimJ/RimL family protein N-acetyltransferase
VEVTYALEPSCWGRGYATEAAAAALGVGFDDAGLREIAGIARAANAASLRVMDKIGMRREGPARYFGTDWIKYTTTAAAWRARLAHEGRPGSRRGAL